MHLVGLFHVRNKIAYCHLHVSAVNRHHHRLHTPIYVKTQ